MTGKYKLDVFVGCGLMAKMANPLDLGRLQCLKLYWDPKNDVTKPLPVPESVKTSSLPNVPQE